MKKLLISLLLLAGIAGVSSAVDTVATSTPSANGPYKFIFSDASDSTGETAVQKVDISTLNGTPTKVRITKMKWSVVGMNVHVLFDHTTDDRVAILSGDGEMTEDMGPIMDPGSSGGTGDVLFTSQVVTSTATVRPGYTVFMELKKVQ